MTDEQPVALVTGGAVRVGAAIVRELAARGYRVAIHANTSLDRAQAVGRRARPTPATKRPPSAPTCATKTPRAR